MVRLFKATQTVCGFFILLSLACISGSVSLWAAGGWTLAASRSNTPIYSVIQDRYGAIAVGGNGLIMRSVDHGFHWVDRYSSVTDPLRSIVSNGQGFVVVGGKGAGVVLTSGDGNNWSKHPLPAGVDPIYAVSWGNQRFVAVGGVVPVSSGGAFSNSVLTSTDGVVWTVQSSGVTGFLHDISFDGQRFVAVGVDRTGKAGLLLTSVDGVSWSSLAVKSTFLTGVGAANGLWVAAGTAGSSLSSSDGLHWVSHTTGLVDALWANGFDGARWLAVGGPLTGANTGDGALYASSDGFSWQLQQLPAGITFIYALSATPAVSIMGTLTGQILVMDRTPPQVSAISSITLAGTGAVKLVADEYAQLHVTTDGSQPLLASPLYASGQSIVVKQSATVRYIAVDLSGNVSAEGQLTVTVTDSDHDGMPDRWESGFGLDPYSAADAALDPDGDGMGNRVEFEQGFDPLVADVVAVVTISDMLLVAGVDNYTQVTVATGVAVAGGVTGVHLELVTAAPLDLYSSYVRQVDGVWTLAMKPDVSGGVRVLLDGTLAGGLAAASVDLYAVLTANAPLFSRYSWAVDRGASSAVGVTSVRMPVVAAYVGKIAVSRQLAITYHMQPGWNLVAFPILPAGGDLLVWLRSQLPQMRSLWAYHQGGWSYYRPGLPASVNTLAAIVPGQAVWVELPMVLKAPFPVFSLAGVQQFNDLSLQQGWSLISMRDGVQDAAAWMGAHAVSQLWGYHTGVWRSAIIGAPSFLNAIQSLGLSEAVYVYVP